MTTNASSLNSAVPLPLSGSTATRPASGMTMTDLDHDSNLTDSIDDENFIALLQYRDAYHILNLASPSESGSPTTADVEKAYNIAKEQALVALEQFEAKRQANSHQGGRNMFFISHQNYLELKLQALDQAYEELMPTVEGMIVQKRDSLHAEEVDFNSPRDIPKNGDWNTVKGDESLSARKSVEKGKGETDPNVASAREFIWNDKSGDAAVANSETNVSLQQPSEDELDTIDIYFRPTSNAKKGLDPPARHRSNTPSSENPSDVSSCTWDGSSIFSMISQTKKNWEDATSEGGLSDVLGPKHSANVNSARVGASDLNTQENKESARKTTTRPPPGIKVKHNMKKQAQISPTSVTCFPPSIHNDQHYDTTSGCTRRSKATLGRGKRMMGRSRGLNSHEATEAARMGILRALSEDNSECLPLEDDDNDEYNNFHFNSLNDTQDTSGEAELSDYNFHGDEQRLVGKDNANNLPLFQGKSDQFSKCNNSIMGSTLNDNSQSREVYYGYRSSSDLNDKRNASASSMRERPTSPRPLTYSKRQQSKSNNSNDDQYESLVHTGIVGALELADEFCATLNSCWKDGVVGSPNGLAKTLSRAGTVATAAFDAAAYELERSTQPLDQSRVEDESTMYSRSTHDGDSAYHNRSVYTTDGESTAFNTLSSFSRQAESISMLESSQRASRSISTNNGPTASQTQTRMLV